MAEVHFLNVLEGDCSIIRHESGHISVIDVNNAKRETERDFLSALLEAEYQKKLGIGGNLQQKNHPENPIPYLKSLGTNYVFRFILTHPDMDHMGGIKDFFEEFGPINFWDIDNNKEIDNLRDKDRDDWNYYKNLRAEIYGGPKRLTLYSNSRGKYYNKGEAENSSGDALYILSPSEELVKEANEKEDWNDASYVLVYYTQGGKIVFGGDSHDKTWEHILAVHSNFVTNIDILIAPHHGRKSKRNYDFLNVLNPKVTFFGNASSQHLAYSAWNYRNLFFITNNQAGNITVNASANPMEIYVTNHTYAQQINPSTCYVDDFKGFYIGSIRK